MENDYLEKRIISTNKWGLIAILHEGLISKFEQATILINKDDRDKLNNTVNRTRDLLAELISLFKGKDELALDLREIYIYTNKLITEGEMKMDVEFFNKANDIIYPILEGFRELEVKNEGNVITGLTYGKQNLEEYRNSGKDFKG